MRKFLLVTFLGFAAIASIGLVVATTLDWSGALDGLDVTIDGETIDTSAIAALIAVAVSVGLLMLCVIVIGALASIAIVVPLVIVIALVVAVVGLVLGVAPLAIPVLLVVGAYALLARWMRRRGPKNAELPAPTPPTPNA